MHKSTWQERKIVIEKENMYLYILYECTLSTCADKYVL